ncbi:SLC5/6 family protein [Neokomagataea anthophila]|uniref:Transporter n=1 Tax=Neokomagataea anthophila TaxID=2826925 RepID=A0ABS5E676_9PROT|nr:transporter [Neokomagataea anthophila]MBR0559414.1 transporter [Neokomagataea anthophila]
MCSQTVPSQGGGQSVRFDGTDIGWTIISIGMAIGAGIVFLPVQVGLVGIWVFLLSSAIGYPGMYLFQRLFINTLASARESQTYPDMIASYLGRGWGRALGVLYFVMITIWLLVYATAITNDSASYLRSFGVTHALLSHYAWYPLILMFALVGIASRGEKTLFKVSTLLVCTKLCIIAVLGFLMISRWNLGNIGAVPPVGTLIGQSVITLPFTLTSILFLQTLSPMVVFYRAQEQSPEVARYKALRVMNIAFAILFVVVFFYAVSFSLAMSHADAVAAYKQNISALAISAQVFGGSWATYIGVVLNIFAVMTAFFGVYLGFKEACQGLFTSIASKWLPEQRIQPNALATGIALLAVALAYGAIVANLPVLSFTAVCSPIFGLIGCLIPAWLVMKTPSLVRYRGVSLYFIVGVGVLLVVSPFLSLL